MRQGRVSRLKSPITAFGQLEVSGRVEILISFCLFTFGVRTLVHIVGSSQETLAQVGRLSCALGRCSEMQDLMDFSFLCCCRSL